MKEREVMKRKMIPHKGGRTTWCNGRCKPEIKAMAQEIKKETGESLSDILEKAVLARHKEIFSRKPAA